MYPGGGIRGEGRGGGEVCVDASAPLILVDNDLLLALRIARGIRGDLPVSSIR